MSLSPKCGFLGTCARFDEISLKAGTIGAVRGGADPRFAALSGWVHTSISFLELADIGVAFGGHMTHDEDGAFHYASMPGILHVTLRGWPWPWRKLLDSGSLQLALSYQRTFVSEKLGAAEPPGFSTDTVRVLASRSFGPVDLDLGVGVTWGTRSDTPDLRRIVEVQGTAALRLFGLARPLSPDEQLRVVAQALYRFPLPGDGNPPDGYVLFGVEMQTHSGYRLGVAAGPYLLGTRVGGLGMLTLSVAWGKRYRNPLAEYIASKPPWIPRFWMDLWHIDPVLDKDGCIKTDPARWIPQMHIKCVGKPDPRDPRMILLDDGRRLPVGTHLWIRNDGMLITQRQEEIAQVDPETAKKAILIQRLIHELRLAEERGETCKARDFLAEMGKTDWNGAVIPEAGGAIRVSNFLNRLYECGVEGAMSGGGFLPIAGRFGLKRGQMAYRATRPKEEDAAVHEQPVQPIKPGKLEIQGKAYQKEIDFAREEAAKGHDVILRGTDAKGYDLWIDGIKWELKHLDQPTKNAVRQRLREGRTQGEGRVIIDGRRVGLTQETAIDALGHHVNSGRLDDAIEVRVLTVDGELRWSQ